MNDETRFELGRVRRDLDFLRGQLTALDTRVATLEKKAQDQPETTKAQRTEILERLSKPARQATPPPLPTVPKPPKEPAKESTSAPKATAGAPSIARQERATSAKAEQCSALQSSGSPAPLKPAVAQTAPKIAKPESEPVAAPPPSEDPESPKPSFEFALGSYWFVRIGIVLLLTGIGFLAKLAYTHWIVPLGAIGKVAGLYFISGALLGAGAWLQRHRKELQNYGQVLFAGGLASVYFTTYAAHYIENVRVISNEFIAGAALLAWAGFIAWLADRRKSEIMALFAIGLAYYTSGVNETGAFTLFSNLALSLAAVWFLVRNRWAILSFVSLAGTYGGWAFWRFHHHGIEVWDAGALPAGDYWLGLGFLACYWIVFTVAVFVSRASELEKQNRSFFLTANNALLVLFGALTTNLAYPDNFWAFPLTVGVLLLGLTLPARRLLADEPTAENSYLVQGLLLVTWGIMAWFTGAQLALSLAIESVVLILLGFNRNSRFMQAGGYITAALAVGVAFDDIRPFESGGLALGISLGALLLFNAWWLNRLNLRALAALPENESDSTGESRSKPDKLPAPEDGIVFFSMAGLIPWFFATWQNFPYDTRPVALALTALAVILSVETLRIRTLSLFGFGYLVCAQGLSFVSFNHATLPHWIHGVAVIVATLGAIFWHQRRQVLKLEAEHENFLTGLNSFAICALTAIVSCQHLKPEWRGPILALEAVVISLSHLRLRINTLSQFGAGYLLLAQAVGFAMAHSHAAEAPLWSPIATAAISLAMLTWWQRQQTLPLDSDWRKALVGLGSIGVVGLVHVALANQFLPEAWLAISALLAVLFAVVGGVLRLWPLAICGQFFLAVSVLEFHRLIFDGQPAWWAALIPVLTLGGYAIAGSEWIHRFGEARRKLADNLTPAVVIARVGLVLMSTIYAVEYLEPELRFLALASIGTAVFLRGAFDQVVGRIETGSAFIGAGYLLFWIHGFDKDHAHAADLIAILIVLGRHIVASRKEELFHLTRRHHTFIILAGGTTLWLWVTRASLHAQENGFVMTLAWGLLAFALTGIGFWLKEREYRRLGIGILLLAMARIFLIDVWELTLPFRVLSFMGLGLVLIGLGYIYNRFQEQVREWI